MSPGPSWAVTGQRGPGHLASPDGQPWLDGWPAFSGPGQLAGGPGPARLQTSYKANGFHCSVQQQLQLRFTCYTVIFRKTSYKIPSVENFQTNKSSKTSYLEDTQFHACSAYAESLEPAAARFRAVAKRCLHDQSRQNDEAHGREKRPHLQTRGERA